MASFEQLDLLLGEALENMMGAAQEIRALDTQKTKEYLRHIGMATGELWGIREDVYSFRPDITRDFVSESKSDRPRFEELSKLHERAGVAEERGDFVLARTLYTELLGKSHYGWFKLLAEAGLYRTSKTKMSPTKQFSRSLTAPADFIVSAALRAALTAELIGPRGPLPRFVFRINIKIKDAKPRRALIRASLTNRWIGSPLHSVAPSARLHYADSAQLRRSAKGDKICGHSRKENPVSTNL
jgi:hypothetical protein